MNAGARSRRDAEMDNRPAVISPNVWIVAVVLLAVGVGIFAVSRVNRSGDAGSGLGEAFDYRIDEHKKVDPALIRYEQTGEIPTGMQQARGVAAGPDDRIYVAGDEVIHVFDSAGSLDSKIALDSRPSCLAVGGREHAFPGRIYLGAGRQIEVLDAEGKSLDRWEVPGEKAQLTSIAAAENDVFVADCGNRIVLRYDTSGKLIGRIGQRDEKHGVHGFVIPSPFFDVAVAPDGLLWVVNPGALRLEAYTFDGRLELFWEKKPGAEIEGFFGCCNPAHFAILPDGRFVTAEKGLLRVKVYGDHGQFDCVVAGPEELDVSPPAGTQDRFDHQFKAVDVAADSGGRVLILDLAGGTVRVFESKRRVSEEEDA